MHLFDKILIANRGEIAVRIIKTAQKLGIATVAVFSPADQNSLAVKLAGEAWPLNNNDLSESYLNINKIISIAKISGAQAIHPGYGFLSENPAFAKACNQANIVFIGPSEESMLLMGNKIASREFVEKLGVPITKGMTGLPEEIVEQAKGAKFPLLIKAAAGGGGKGMKIVQKKEDLLGALETASREAYSYFGNGSVFAEKYIEKPRHIEIQLIGDKHGNVIYLYERECSVQRRYQKIIEEAPASHLNERLRANLAKAATDIAKATSYHSAGTIEFLVENEEDFYFLEMNTRIQVEHPVSELITGIDIVEEQIKIAAGLPLGFVQENIKSIGHAIECRIYAEDAEQNFMPAPGRIINYKEPFGTNIRVDSGIMGPCIIQSFFDPMVSKLIVHSNSRAEAIQKMTQALEQYTIQGIKHNIPYLLSILKDEIYLQNQIWTKFCETNLDKNLTDMADLKQDISREHILLSFASYTLQRNHLTTSVSTWQQIGFWRDMMELDIEWEDKLYNLIIIENQKTNLVFGLNGNSYDVEILELIENYIRVIINGFPFEAHIKEIQGAVFDLMHKGFNFKITRKDYLDEDKIYLSKIKHQSGIAEVKSPMPGKVVKLNCQVNQEVNQGDILLIVESMKMENNILAPGSGKVTEVFINEGELIDSSKTLLRIE